MLTNNDKRLRTDINCWLAGSYKEGVVINELAPIVEKEKRSKSKSLEINIIFESSKNKKPGFITSIRTGRGITGTTIQRYKKIIDHE